MAFSAGCRTAFLLLVLSKGTVTEGTASVVRLPECGCLRFLFSAVTLLTWQFLVFDIYELSGLFIRDMMADAAALGIQGFLMNPMQKNNRRPSKVFRDIHMGQVIGVFMGQGGVFINLPNSVPIYVRVKKKKIMWLSFEKGLTAINTSADRIWRISMGR